MFEIDQLNLLPEPLPPPGRPLLVRIELLREDPNNPRTDFPDAELDELERTLMVESIIGRSPPWPR